MAPLLELCQLFQKFLGLARSILPDFKYNPNGGILAISDAATSCPILNRCFPFQSLALSLNDLKQLCIPGLKKLSHLESGCLLGLTVLQTRRSMVSDDMTTSESASQKRCQRKLACSSSTLLLKLGTLQSTRHK